MEKEPENKPEETPDVSPKKDTELNDQELGDVAGAGCGCMGMPKDPVGCMRE